MRSKKAAWKVCWLPRARGRKRTPRARPILAEFQAGLKAGQWKRAKEIQRWLQSRHQVKMRLKGVYYWLGKLGGVLKVPRKTHAEKDAAKAAQFRQELCAVPSRA